MNEKDIIRQIDAASVEDREFRPYLGASLIGNNCEAFLQMQLKGYPSKDFAPHTLRIFALGHVLEDMVVADLRKAGFKVMEKDDLTGRQFEWKECGGHVKAHADGLIDIDTGSLSLLEIKSMNDKKWGEFKKEGVRISHPNYYAQCQMMMGWERLRTLCSSHITRTTVTTTRKLFRLTNWRFRTLHSRLTGCLLVEEKERLTLLTAWFVSFVIADLFAGLTRWTT